MGRWRTTCGILLAICVAASIPAAAATDDAARAAAEGWLKLRDAGDYEACWNQSARFFRQKVTSDQVTKDEWKEGSARYQMYLGRTLSRKLRSLEYMDRLPEFPPGRQAVVRFDTVFERTGTMVEIVALMLEDGVWRVSATR